ncbi:MAG: ABC transporter permease subunit, partial [Hyphomicrobiaceae bacterium]|nr:ABC transporter permease subunit [Hyphomicrobiaceae bacterium]
LVGLLNTLLVAAVGIVLATLLGFVAGIARLSKNPLLSGIAAAYVETLRNIPLLLQIFFWYFAVLRAVPERRDKVSLFDTFHLNISGFYFPKPVFAEGSGVVLAGFAAAIIASFVLGSWAKKRQMSTGQQFPVFKASLAMIFGIPLVLYFIMGMPISLEHPVFVSDGPVFRRGFTTGVGGVLIPEFLALLFALSLYTASFIAEIVRAGILAVSHGQTEAAYALGLRSGPTLRLVVIPQAMRVIIPPLTSQYLNLTKNSSLAVAIAYPDLVSVGGTTLNQTGQAIEIVSVWMVVYLSLSVLTSGFMNWYNKRMALVER